MKVSFRQHQRELNRVTFIDPANFSDSVTVKSAVRPKKAGSLTVHNVKASINANKIVTIASDCADACAPKNQERLSATIDVSGSTSSKAALIELRQALFSAWIELENDLISGFIPESTSISFGVEP